MHVYPADYSITIQRMDSRSHGNGTTRANNPMRNLAAWEIKGSEYLKGDHGDRVLGEWLQVL